MPVLLKLGKHDIDELARKLEEVAADAATPEECAQRWCFYLYDHLAQQDGTSACVLVRCFRTFRYSELTTELRTLAAQVGGASEMSPNTPCVVLMGSAGAHPDWNSRHRSTGHRVIPLPSPQIVARLPMIAQLFRQLGVDVHEVIAGNGSDDGAPVTALNVFYVPDANGSPHIPAQGGFVLPYKVHTVFGFGGLLAGGNVFAVIVFTSLMLPSATAHLFQELAAHLQLALSRFEAPVLGS